MTTMFMIIVLSALTLAALRRVRYVRRRNSVINQRLAFATHIRVTPNLPPLFGNKSRAKPQVMVFGARGRA